jgi:RimJ/RimL family protein N-acetyltransferase
LFLRARNRLKAPRRPLTDGVVALRPWTPADVPAIVKAIDADPEITRWLEMIPQPYSAADAQAYVSMTIEGWSSGTGGAFAVVDAVTGELVGSMGLRLADPENAVGEIGYWARSDARGRGYMTRALRLISRWALEEVRLERLQLRAELQNLPSQRVAERAGFRREGVIRSARYNPRQRRRMDWVIFSLLPGELDR